MRLKTHQGATGSRQGAAFSCRPSARPATGWWCWPGRNGMAGGDTLSAGEEVWPMRRSRRIPDLSQMRVALELTQEQARQVKRKQKARVRVETAPGKVFSGEVTDLAQNAPAAAGGWMPTGEHVFECAVLIKDTKGAFLRPGTTSQATIIVEHLPKVLALPLECVFDREGKKVVVRPARRGVSHWWRCNSGPGMKTGRDHQRAQVGRSGGDARL